MKRALKATVFAASVLAAPNAWAQCVSIDPTMVPDIRLDPMNATGSAELVQPFTLTFRRAMVDNQPIQLRYQILDEDSAVQSRVGASEGPVAVWQSHDSSRDVGGLRNQSYALMNSSLVLIGQDEAASQRQIMLRLTDLRSDLHSGIYREQFTVRYWCDSEGVTPPFESVAVVGVSVVVPNVLSASIAGASAQGEIDFLDFSSLDRRLQISVRSTGPYRVTAKSLNSGFMLREGSAGTDASDRIRYDATLGGQSIGVGEEAAVTMPRAGLAGRQLPLGVAVQDVGSNRAGAYTDTLLLTLAPAN
jgi:hypothetical protein